MDVAYSIRKFFDHKVLYVLSEGRSGKLYLELVNQIDYDSSRHDERIVQGGYGGFFDGLYTAWIHAYSLKHAKELALERISNLKERINSDPSLAKLHVWYRR
jgi:hypothetical protein